MRESGQNLCAVLLMFMLSTHDNTFQVKSFVDSGNNGLDGVRISHFTITACSTNSSPFRSFLALSSSALVVLLSLPSSRQASFSPRAVEPEL